VIASPDGERGLVEDLDVGYEEMSRVWSWPAGPGVVLMRQNLRRRHVEESDDEIEERLEAWLRDRPMDAPGQVVEGALP